MQAFRSLSIALAVTMMACAITLRMPDTYAEPWTGTYRSGGEVRVDPRTNRATIKRDGVESQLWDGVHRLDDGSTITTHAGQVVPNRDILDSRHQPVPPEVIKRLPAHIWMGPPIIGRSPCEKLVTRVCGSDLACAEDEACSMSRQLLNFENRERAASRMHNFMTRASGDCLEAQIDDTYFATCARSKSKPQE